MNRARSLWILAVLAGASCVWWTGLRADDTAAVAPPSDQTAELLARIEKLERRVSEIEGKQQAARQIDTLFAPVGGWLAAPAGEAKPALPPGALIVPPKAERPTGGVFLPRHIVVTPE